MSETPTFCTTRGQFFEPISVRKIKAKEARREARAAAIARDQQRKRDARALKKKQTTADEQVSHGARSAFKEDSDNPSFEKLKGKFYNW